MDLLITLDTHIYPLDAFNDAMDDLEHGKLHVAATGGLGDHSRRRWILRLGEIPAREQIVPARLPRARRMGVLHNS